MVLGIVFKNLKGILLSAMLMLLTIPALQAKGPQKARLKLNLQEAVILEQFLQQIEVSTEELEPFLALQTALEQLIAQHPTDANLEQELILRLSRQSVQDLLIFMQRITIKSGGARQVNAILEKLQKHLPKNSPLREEKKSPPKKVNFQLTPQEALLLQQLLLRIEVGIPEIKAFMALYGPLEETLRNVHDATEPITWKLPENGAKNLLVFTQRFSIVGSQAKPLHDIIERLQQFQGQPEQENE